MRKLSNYIISPDGKLYHASDDTLYHAYKYIKRERKNGKWRYTYPDDPKAEKIKVPDPPKYESLGGSMRMDPDMLRYYPDYQARYAKESIDSYNRKYAVIKEKLKPTKPVEARGPFEYIPLTGESLGPPSNKPSPYETGSAKGKAANEKRRLEKNRERVNESLREYEKLSKKQKEELTTKKESEKETVFDKVSDVVDKTVDKGRSFVDSLFSGKKKKR